MIETKGYKIIQTNKTDSYTLYIKGDHKYDIYLSISETDILSNTFYDDEENNEHIIFTAETVETLTNFLKKSGDKLTMEQTIKMINDLSKQLAHLELSNFAFYGFDLDDVLVINGSIFFVANTRYLLDIEETNIHFYSPIRLPYFSSPEVAKLTTLPSKVNYRSNYYSLGSLILFCLFNVHIPFGLQMGKNVDTQLQSLCNTKMYWFLKRCFLPNSEKRILLYI